MQLNTVLKINFYSGLFGSFVLTPCFYVLEAIQSGGKSELLRFGLLDIFMTLVAPFIAGLAFAVAGLFAYAFIRMVQRTGLLKNVF